MSRSPTFCVLPWVHLATNSSGYLRVCCNSTSGKNLLVKDDGSPYRLAVDALDEAWNSRVMREIRRQMIRGEEPSICQRCFTEERSGVKSARMKWNSRWTSTEEHSTNPPMNPKYVDLRLGNLCNLKCRMCNPYASSKWISEWNQVVDSATLVPNQPLSDHESKRLSKMTWMEDETTWKNLDQVMAQVEEVYLTGGEPTLIKAQFQFLRRVVDRGFAPSMNLKYNTNLTTISNSMLELWKNFKVVKLNVSIDGYGRLNEYIRHPSNWETLSGNLDRVFSLQREGQAIQVGIHTTVQNYNILNLRQLFIHLDEHYGVFPYLNILNHPKGMNIRNLPADLKEEAANRLKSFDHETSVKEVLSYMGHTTPAQDFSEFIRFTNRCDEIRGQKFLDLVPEFQPHWNFDAL